MRNHCRRVIGRIPHLHRVLSASASNPTMAKVAISSTFPMGTHPSMLAAIVRGPGRRASPNIGLNMHNWHARLPDKATREFRNNLWNDPGPIWCEFLAKSLVVTIALRLNNPNFCHNEEDTHPNCRMSSWGSIVLLSQGFDVKADTTGWFSKANETPMNPLCSGFSMVSLGSFSNAFLCPTENPKEP